MKYTAVRKDGTPVREGDTIETHDGSKATFIHASRPTVPGKSGKVVIEPSDQFVGQELYAHLFDLTVVAGDA